MTTEGFFGLRGEVLRAQGVRSDRVAPPPPRANDMVEVLRRGHSIQQLDRVTGPYDVIAVVEASDLNVISDIITNEIHSREGVVRSTTCIRWSHDRNGPLRGSYSDGKARLEEDSSTGEPGQEKATVGAERSQHH